MRRRHRHFNARDLGAGFVFDARYIDQSDNTAVSTWSDRSRNGWDATQTSASLQPTFQTAEFGGNGVVRFDGSNDILSVSGAVGLLNNVAGATLMAVAKYVSGGPSGFGNSIFFSNNASVSRARMSGGSASNYDVGGRRLDADSFATINGSTFSASRILIHVGVFDYSNSDLFLFLDGTQEASNTSFQTAGNTSATNSGSVSLGNNSAPQPMNGDLGQALAFNTVLTASQRKRVEHAAAYSFKISCN